MTPAIKNAHQRPYRQQSDQTNRAQQNIRARAGPQAKRNGSGEKL
jgi:hypothetical protein